MFLPLTPVRFLLWAAQCYGSKVGVVDGERRFTYAEVLDRSLRLVAALQGLGIQPGDRVATLSFNCHQLIEAYYGVPMANAIVLPLNVRLAPEELSTILDHAGASLVLFDPEFLPLAQALAAANPGRRWVSFEPLPERPEWILPETYEELLAAVPPKALDYTSIDENAIAELFYTSGSTAHPKGVMLSHRTLYLHALTCQIGMTRRGGAVAADRAVELHTIAMFHANGWGRAHTVTMTGGRHVMIKRFDPRTVCSLIQREGVTCFSMVPTMAAALLNDPELDRYDLSSLDEIMLGGAAASPSLVAAMEKRFGCPVYAGYGLTETSPVTMLAHLKGTLGPLSTEERTQRQAMTGFPFPCVEARVVDPAGKDVPKDGQTRGEILFRGDLVMDGYWGDPAATSSAIEDSWLRTGDVAVWDEHNYLLIVDRQKDIIVSGGENVSSLEIEKVLAAHPAVYETAVIAVPDDKWGEAAMAYVVCKPGVNITDQELRDYVRRHLAGFKVPKYFELCESLPKGPTGKIHKRALREPHWQGMAKRVQGTASFRQ